MLACSLRWKRVNYLPIGKSVFFKLIFMKRRVNTKSKRSVDSFRRWNLSGILKGSHTDGVNALCLSPPRRNKIGDIYIRTILLSLIWKSSIKWSWKPITSYKFKPSSMVASVIPTCESAQHLGRPSLTTGERHKSTCQIVLIYGRRTINISRAQ